ncbi:MAG TPA: hypothetical protein PK995_08790 [Bacteroidia bacterium]|jgi:hypothetical protein|nr:hypothetical protein [Bacteroidia bacterium]
MKTKVCLILYCSIMMLMSCKKKPAPVDNSNNSNSSAVKVYMNADKTTIRLGQEAVVTANVEGGSGSLTYEWEVNTISNLLGSGNTVTFTPCCSSVAGENIIKCNVTDSKGNKGVGQITIIVNP